MIFRHGCGGDCGCECVPCNHCNPENDDLLPATITATFTFSGGAYGQCGRLYDGEPVVLARGFITGGDCPVCRYEGGSVCGEVELEVRFLGIGLGVSISLMVSPCGVEVNYLGEGADCLQSATTFTNGTGVTVTLAPGGTMPTPKVLARPTSATVSLSCAELNGTATASPLLNALAPTTGNLSSWGPLTADDPYFTSRLFVGLVALFSSPTAPEGLGMQLRHACPFYWDIALTATGQKVYQFANGAAIRRNLGLFGAVHSRTIPTLADFQAPGALIPLAANVHTIQVGGSAVNMLTPYADWLGVWKADWATNQALGYLPSPEVAAIPPAYSASWTANF